MATVSTQPINIIQGRQTAVDGGQGIGYGTIAVVIYNTTQVILQVTHPEGVSYLQPNSADIFPCMAGMVPKVSPIVNNIPLGLLGVAQLLYVGTITTTFYDVNDGWPSGFPQPLVPFSGGSLLVASLVPASLATFTLVTPQGTGVLTFNVTSGGHNLIVIGYTSSTTYYNASPASGATVNIPVPAANNDTIFLCGNAGNIMTAYATS